MNETKEKDDFKGEMLTTLSNWATFYDLHGKLTKLCKYFQNGLIRQNCMFSQNT